MEWIDLHWDGIQNWIAVRAPSCILWTFAIDTPFLIAQVLPGLTLTCSHQPPTTRRFHNQKHPPSQMSTKSVQLHHDVLICVASSRGLREVAGFCQWFAFPLWP